MPQRGVPPASVVEALDVLEDRTPRYLTVRPRVAVDQLSLQGRNETLGHRVVVGIGHRSHRGQKTFLSEPAAELHGGVLAATEAPMYVKPCVERPEGGGAAACRAHGPGIV